MRTLDDALNQFAYHPATPDVAATFAFLRERVSQLAIDTWDEIPDGPEKTLAFRGLQQFLMHANLAIALTTPADLKTADVARVLPGTWRCSTCKTEQESHLVKIHCCPAHAGNGPICAACATTFHPETVPGR